MGVLNRLIGDQRKLFQARASSDYFFADMEAIISFDEKITSSTDEAVFLRNIKPNNFDQNSFSGLLISDHKMFSPDARQLWDVLSWDVSTIISFIQTFEQNDTGRSDFAIDVFQTPDISALGISSMFENAKSQKVNKETDMSLVRTVLVNKGFITKEQSDKISVETLYCSSLYLRLSSLEINAVDVFGGKGLIPGFSKRGFTKKDFMKRLSTGGGKIIRGNPYKKIILKKGQKPIDVSLQKEDGVITVEISCAKKDAVILADMIKYAGVSAFTLGKKGLAYVERVKV
jgi:hypothetical protein